MATTRNDASEPMSPSDPVAPAVAVAAPEALAVIAHELRAPLHTLGLGAAVLRRRLGQASVGPRELGMLELMERTIARMSRLVDDLLDAARFDAGTFALRIEPAMAEPLIAEASRLCAAFLDGRQLRLDVTSCLPAVRADGDRVIQVLVNLLANAAKFSPPGGEIGIGAAVDSRVLRLSVSNVGPAIPEEHLCHLFQRFWQGTTDRRGVGLGLSICKDIVLAHGGEIWFERRDGAVNVFAFTLPRADEPLALGGGIHRHSN